MRTRTRMRQVMMGGVAAAVFLCQMNFAGAVELPSASIGNENEDVIEQLLSQDQTTDPESCAEVHAIVYGCDSYGLRSVPNGEEIVASLESGHQLVLHKMLITQESETWYEISTQVSGVAYSGYIPAAYVLCIDQTGLDTIPVENASDTEAANTETAHDYAVDFEMNQMVGADAFESSIAAFPDSYKDRLHSLHAAHPNWVFIPQITNVDWNTFIEAEMYPSRSLIERSVDDTYKGKQSWAYNSETGEYIGLSGHNWVQASQEAVAYFADPRNFIRENDIFQFELLTYNSNYQTEGGVEAIVNGTFMSHAVMPDDSRTYAQALCQAGAEVNVSPYMLAARVRQEQGGAGSSPLISGSYAGYEGLYNYFNIHAYGNTEEEIYANGLSYAREHGWTSRYASLVGGASVLGGNYISKGQDTLYLQKFDVDDAYYGRFSHQYMQNIRGAYNEGRTAYKAYSEIGILNNTFVFKIPVYNNMPLTACPMPESASRRAEVEGFISRLYVNILGRSADASGMEHWYNCLTNGGETAAAVTTRFVFSKEFTNQNLSDDEFVERMYLTMLNRASDPAGKAHWKEFLEVGCSRRYVLSRFVASKEFTNICDSYNIAKGSVILTEARDQYTGATRFVTRLYQTALHRKPDVDGLNHWVSLIGTKQTTPYDVAERIVKSQEFKNYNYSNEEYVTILYRAFLNREPESEGMAHWLNKLNSGVSREEILRGFAYSKEFKNLASSYGL